jgi:hypothetical protein
VGYSPYRTIPGIMKAFMKNFETVYLIGGADFSKQVEKPKKRKTILIRKPILRLLYKIRFSKFLVVSFGNEV